MFRKSILVLAAALGGLFLAPGCAKQRAVKRADQVAKAGDWETALTQYRLAAAEHPGDEKLAERVTRAKREVANLYLQRAAQANASGDLGLAGDLWKKAMEMSPDPLVVEQVRTEIQANASALEYFGDSSADFYAWEDAIGAYGALLVVQPNSVDVLEKYREAKREFAGDLTVASDELTRKNLKGAALVTSLRALQHDPMQQGAFDRVSSLRRELAGRTRIALQEVEVRESNQPSSKAFALALSPKLTPRIDDFPPYGPTKDPGAIPAQFVVIVEDLERDETVVKGSDVLPNTIPASKVPVPNPAVAEQEKQIAKLNKELRELKDRVNKLRTGKEPRKGKAPPKKKLAQTEAQRRKEGLELARKVDAKRAEIAAALVHLKTLPATVPPPPPPETFTLAWKDVTRTVEAKVRFEIREKDFEEPLTVTITKKMSKMDRTHEGNEKQGVFPDALELPTFEAMVQELASEFADGANVIAQARDRRVKHVLAEARSKKAAGEDEAALDAFVESLFLLGPEQLPDDAAVEVAKSAENAKLKEILGTTK